MKYNNIKNLYLRSDLANKKVKPEWLIANGEISDEPNTWAIDGDLDNFDSSYLYESEYEYNNDVELLQLDS